LKPAENKRRNTGFFEQYKGTDGGVLTAVNGVWFQPFKKAGRDHCFLMTNKGTTACCRSMAAAVIARRGGDAVLPLAPEMLRNKSAVPDKAKETGKKIARSKNRTASGRR
jgi:hypothetical protein